MELLMAIVRDTQNERYTPMNRLIIFLDDLTLIAVAVMLMWSLSLLGAWSTTNDDRRHTADPQLFLNGQFWTIPTYSYLCTS